MEPFWPLRRPSIRTVGSLGRACILPAAGAPHRFGVGFCAWDRSARAPSAFCASDKSACAPSAIVPGTGLRALPRLLCLGRVCTCSPGFCAWDRSRNSYRCSLGYCTWGRSTSAPSALVPGTGLPVCVPLSAPQFPHLGHRCSPSTCRVAGVMPAPLSRGAFISERAKSYKSGREACVHMCQLSPHAPWSMVAAPGRGSPSRVAYLGYSYRLQYRPDGRRRARR